MEEDKHLYTDDGRPLIRLNFLDELVEGSRRAQLRGNPGLGRGFLDDLQAARRAVKKKLRD